MPRPYPPEFRARAIALVRAGKQAKQTAVLDAYSRRIVGWSIDSRQDSTLVVNALDMAIRNRRPEPGGIVHADHGTHR